MAKDPIIKIFHESDLAELLRANFDDLLSNSSSQFKIYDSEIINNCVCVFLLFSKNFGMRCRPMFLLESTALLRTGVI